MRVNVYAEELTDRVEVISKEIDGHTYRAVRFYLELPCTIPSPANSVLQETLESLKTVSIHAGGKHNEESANYGLRVACGVLEKIIEERERENQTLNVNGPFMHRPGDDDSAAVTFWGRSRLRELFVKAIEALDNAE